ncbi:MULTISPECIES: adenosylcobinamide-GDP ribazoletransferase [unclassified Luteococcus]|uniref:adenosylcobinamide-GDP ribazoletransferase n=1 Tax=unclassified Luteococcus TaxID=2639923 RepID=UPI00313B10BD
MKSLVTALGMFTLLPVPPTMELTPETNRRVMLALPWAGLVCGLVSAAAAALVVLCGAGNILAAMAGLAALAGVTGAMHLDGVADTADGLASRKGPQEALALMKQSDIGPMGVATAVLVLLLQASALASTALGGWLLVAALTCLPMVGKVAALFATVEGIPGARAGGFGALFTGITSRVNAVIDAMLVSTATAGLGLLASWDPTVMLAFVAAAVISWLVAGRWQRHLLRRLGGLTGDTFGSLIEVCQTTFVVVLALLTGLISRLS